MPKRGMIKPLEPDMHERPMNHDEYVEISRLRANLLSAFDMARILEYMVNHYPSQSLDRETCTRVCEALHRHSETAGPSHPFDTP